MKELFLIVGLILLYGISGWGSQDIQKCLDTESKLAFVQDQLFIVFYRGTESSRIREIHDSLNVEVLDTMQTGGVISLIKVPDGLAMEELCKKYHNFPEVEAVNLNYTGIRPLEEKP